MVCDALRFFCSYLGLFFDLCGYIRAFSSIRTGVHEASYRGWARYLTTSFLSSRLGIFLFLET